MNEIIGLSLFNGHAGAQISLDQARFKVKKMFISEIDKFANQVNNVCFPESEQLGDVRNVNIKMFGGLIPDIILGGSPCQSFSFAGKRKGMAAVEVEKFIEPTIEDWKKHQEDEENTYMDWDDYLEYAEEQFDIEQSKKGKITIEILSLDHYLQLKSENFEFEGQSYLFWEYIRVLEEVRTINPNVYFFLENVEMGEKWEKVLNKAIGVNGIHVNSALVSAQNRKRIYWFGQNRERLFFNDNYCYICNHERTEKKKRRIFAKTPYSRISKILGSAQRRQEYLRNMQSRIFENKSQRYNKDLFTRLSGTIKEKQRQKSRQRTSKRKSQKVYREKQGIPFAISTGLPKDNKGKGSRKKIGTKSIKKISQANENSFEPRIIWTKEEAEQRRIDYNIKYGKKMCCVQCGKELDHRSYNSTISGWNQCAYKSPSSLSEMQFNEARQNNGRVFDILEFGEIDSNLFGETIRPIPQPKDRGILLRDILENEVDEKYYLSEKAQIRHSTNLSSRLSDENEKCGALLANQYKQSTDMLCVAMRGRGENNEQQLEPRSDSKTNAITSVQKDNLIICHNTMPRSSKTGKGGTGPLSRSDGKTYCLDTGKTNAIEFVSREVLQLNPSKESGGKQPYQHNRVYSINGLSPCLDTDSGRKNIEVAGCDYRSDEGIRYRDGGKSGTLAARARTDESCGQLVSVSPRIRRLTVRECARLQTIPEHIADKMLNSGVSDSQLYKMLGNGWNIETIVHFLKYMK